MSSVWVCGRRKEREDERHIANVDEINCRSVAYLGVSDLYGRSE